MSTSLTPAEGALRFRERQARKTAPLPVPIVPPAEVTPVAAQAPPDDATPAPKGKRRYTRKVVRRYSPKPCAKVKGDTTCGRVFTPTGSRAEFCEACR